MTKKTASAFATLLSVAAATAQSPDLTEPHRVLELQAKLHHVQGIDVEGNLLWVSSVDRETKRGFLHLFDRKSGKRIREVEVQDGDRFHPGGIALDGNAIWVPVAEYRRASTTVIQKRDKRTLELIASFPVADHIGCVAAGGGNLIGGNWDSRDLYSWTRDGRQLDRRPNPSKTSYQDLKWRGSFLIGSGPTGRDTGAVEWLRWPTLDLHYRLTLNTTDRNVRYTNEGMTIRGHTLYLLPEDGPSRLFSFRLP